MTSTFRAVLIIGLLSLWGASTVQAAPVSGQSATASSTGKTSTAQKTTPTKKAPVKKPPTKKAAPVKKKTPVAKKPKASPEVTQAKLPPTRLDLSLPADMVRHLHPLGTTPQPKSVPLLPPMFGEKPAQDSAFQINGRLLSNEMQLQLRSEERHEVEGAALDFQFKQ